MSPVSRRGTPVTASAVAISLVVVASVAVVSTPAAAAAVVSTPAAAAVVSTPAVATTPAVQTARAFATAPAFETVDVDTTARLEAALAAARPGQTIRLAAGTYDGAFLARTPGTADAPITVTGPPEAVLTNPAPSGSAPACPVPTPGWDPGYGLWLVGAAHWHLVGFTVADAKKGIVIDGSRNVTVDGVHVHHTGDEGVHFRRSSADGVIRNSRVDHTGLAQPGYGEAVYIGSARSNWDCHGASSGVDRSDRVQVLDNRFGPHVTAEHIDAKEGTVGGVIRGNTFDGRGISGQNSADSWVDLKGSGYVVEDNTGTYAPPGTFANGYETHHPVAGSGCGNVWRRNASDLGGVGRWAVNVTSTSKCAGNPNVVYASNTVTGATRGLTTIAVTPDP